MTGPEGRRTGRKAGEWLLTLQEVSARLNLSERTIRTYIKKYDLPIRRVPCPGGTSFEFSEMDIQRIWEISRDLQEYMSQYHPQLYPHLRKDDPPPAPMEEPARPPEKPPQPKATGPRWWINGTAPCGDRPGMIHIRRGDQVTTITMPPNVREVPRLQRYVGRQVGNVLGPAIGQPEIKRQFYTAIGTAIWGQPLASPIECGITFGG